MKGDLEIVLAQLNFLVGDVAGNTEKIIQNAIYARDKFHADVIVFSELSLTGYPLEDLLFHPMILQHVDESLEKIKREVHDIYLLLGAPTKEGESLFNSALLIHNTEIVATYHKHRLPNYEVFDEKRYFQQGRDACVVNVQEVKIGITICEDIWCYQPAQKSVKAGAEIIININASPYRIDKTPERIQVLRTRVEEQDVPVIYVNQIGGQDELVFDGESLCINRNSEICLRAPAFEQGVYMIRYSKDRSDLMPSDHVYAPLPKLASIYQALLTGVRDYVVKNRFHGIVLGLSGGIDSALTLVIAVDALGVDRVRAVMMPFRYTSDISIEDAKQLADTLGLELDEIPIGTAFNAIMGSVAPMFSGLPQDVTEENVQSRIRGLFLMAIANKTGRMLLTTGNKSEMSVGYATLYGDMAGGFAPLKDVSKTLVYQLATYRNELGRVIPMRVLTRAPSAELAPDQVDEDNLPPYSVLDPILEKFIEKDLTADQIIAEGFDRKIVQRVIRMVLRNEHKRRQAPPGVKITSRAFGKDRRYPITSGFLRSEQNAEND